MIKFLQDHKANMQWVWDSQPDLFDCQRQNLNQSPPVPPTSSSYCLKETVKNDLSYAHPL